MQRRTFLKQGSGALVGSLWACSASWTGGGAPSASGADRFPRIGVTTVSFRSRFPATRSMNGGPVTNPELTLPAAPEFFAREVGLHNVEIWDLQFAEQSVAYCQSIRVAAEAAGSRIANLQIDGVGDLSAAAPATRAEALAKSKAWMDRAVVLGSPRIRFNTGPGPGQPFDLGVTSDSFRQLAEYGERVGVTVLVENHGTPIPDVVAIVNEVNHPRCRSLVDFGNTTPGGTTEEKIAALRPMFDHLGFVSAKASEFDDEYRHTSWDIGALVRAIEQSGYRGIYSVELWNTSAPPADTVRAARAVRDTIARNLHA